MENSFLGMSVELGNPVGAVAVSQSSGIRW